MGISIHYKGRLKAKSSLPGLIEEVKDIAEIYKWRYFIFEEQFPVGGFGKPALTIHFIAFLSRHRAAKQFT
jgi:hypothetical protein